MMTFNEMLEKNKVIRDALNKAKASGRYFEIKERMKRDLIKARSIADDK